MVLATAGAMAPTWRAPFGGGEHALHFTSLGGTSGNWLTTGATSIYAQDVRNRVGASVHGGPVHSPSDWGSGGGCPETV